MEDTKTRTAVKHTSKPSILSTAPHTRPSTSPPHSSSTNLRNAAPPRHRSPRNVHTSPPTYRQRRSTSSAHCSASLSKAPSSRTPRSAFSRRRERRRGRQTAVALSWLHALRCKMCAQLSDVRGRGTIGACREVWNERERARRAGRCATGAATVGVSVQRVKASVCSTEPWRWRILRVSALCKVKSVVASYLCASRMHTQTVDGSRWLLRNLCVLERHKSVGCKVLGGGIQILVVILDVLAVRTCCIPSASERRFEYARDRAKWHVCASLRRSRTCRRAMISTTSSGGSWSKFRAILTCSYKTMQAS